MSDNEKKKVSEDACVAAEEHVPATSDEMKRPVDEIADEAGCSNDNEHEAEASASESYAEINEEGCEEASADAEENVGQADAEAAEDGKKGRKKAKEKRAKGQPHSKMHSGRRISDSACTARLLLL